MIHIYNIIDITLWSISPKLVSQTEQPMSKWSYDSLLSHYMKKLKLKMPTKHALARAVSHIKLSRCGFEPWNRARCRGVSSSASVPKLFRQARVFILPGATTTSNHPADHHPGGDLAIFTTKNVNRPTYCYLQEVGYSYLVVKMAREDPSSP